LRFKHTQGYSKAGNQNIPFPYVSNKLEAFPVAAEKPKRINQDYPIAYSSLVFVILFLANNI
jgi:hypothetical protein